MTGTITMHERKPSGQLTAAETQSVGTLGPESLAEASNDGVELLHMVHSLVRWTLTILRALIDRWDD